MSSERDFEKWMASAEVREYARGNKPEKPHDIHPHVGLAGDETVRRLLSHMAEHYDPERAAELGGVDVEDMPSNVTETALYRAVLKKEGTETVTRAIHRGETQTQSFVVGDPASRSDISGLRAIDSLRDMITTPAPIIYIFGEPGSGKTSFGLLAAQMWKREHPDGELGSNIRTWEEADKWCPSYGSLRSWLDEQLVEMDSGGETLRDGAAPRLFVFDEASSHASGRGKVGHEAGAKLGPLVYKIRKANCGLIIIGHDGKDVHPAVRTLATVVQKFRGEVKKAELFEDVQNRQGVGHIMSLRGIPETDYSYDDKEATSWSWETAETPEQADREAVLEEARSMAADMEESHVRRLAHRLDTDPVLDLEQDEIGRAIGMAVDGKPRSQQWVSKWSTRIQREMEDEDVAMSTDGGEDE
jgi:hypothetical protein